MPVLEISALPVATGVDVPEALSRVNHAIAGVYGCAPEQVWSLLTIVAPGHYAEGGNAAFAQPEETHPPVCRLTCFEGRTPDEIEHLLRTASRALGTAFGWGDNVFITYHEARAGQVIAGNGVVRG